MNLYKTDELQEALGALRSLLSKCETIDSRESLGKPQQTLLDRRIRALRIAIALISEKLEESAA